MKLEIEVGALEQTFTSKSSYFRESVSWHDPRPSALREGFIGVDASGCLCRTPKEFETAVFPVCVYSTRSLAAACGGAESGEEGAG